MTTSISFHHPQLAKARARRRCDTVWVTITWPNDLSDVTFFVDGTDGDEMELRAEKFVEAFNAFKQEAEEEYDDGGEIADATKYALAI